MIIGFLDDKALHNNVTGLYSESLANSGYGYLTDYLQSYFVEDNTLRDSRTTRLLVDNVVSTFENSIRFDPSKDTTNTDWSAITSGELDKLFNIIEALSYNAIDTNTGLGTLTNSDLEDLLVNSPTTFGVYVPNTMALSVSNATKAFRINNVATPVDVIVHDWIGFTALLNGVEVDFKLFLSEASMTGDYPYVTFTHVCYPDDPSRLLAGAYASGSRAMAFGSAASLGDISDVVTDEDNSGVRNFSSEYNPNGVSNALNDDVVFAVFYKGRPPQTHEVRTFIREDLLGRGLAVEDVWKPILPDLFTSGRMFIIPVWNNTTDIPNNITLQIPIVNLKSADSLANVVCPNYTVDFVSNNVELTSSSATQLNLVCVPDEGNDPAFFSLKAAHPTYQSVDGLNSFFAHQTLATQDFNVSLSNCLAQLMGSSNNQLFGEDEFHGRQWYTFNADYREYHVLKPDQFPAVF